MPRLRRRRGRASAARCARDVRVGTQAGCRRRCARPPRALPHLSDSSTVTESMCRGCRPCAPRSRGSGDDRPRGHDQQHGSPRARRLQGLVEQDTRRPSHEPVPVLTIRPATAMAATGSIHSMPVDCTSRRPKGDAERRVDVGQECARPARSAADCVRAPSDRARRATRSVDPARRDHDRDASHTWSMLTRR